MQMQVQSVDEAITLMQKGVHFDRRMSQLAPRLKIVKMLENNDLLDESKVGYLIDLAGKNPQAIAKLVKEAGFDPLSNHEEQAAAYKPGNHSVSDRELAFREAVESLEGLEDGTATINAVMTWDAESKRKAYAEPQVLEVIHSQRANGIYDKISTEINRQKVLGHLKGTSFLDAYQIVGDAMHAQGLLTPVKQAPAAEGGNAPAPAQSAAPTAKPSLAPLATRVAPVPSAAPNPKARAAAPTRATPTQAARTEVNPFDMPDDEFTKQYGPR